MAAMTSFLHTMVRVTDPSHHHHTGTARHYIDSFRKQFGEPPEPHVALLQKKKIGTGAQRQT